MNYINEFNDLNVALEGVYPYIRGMDAREVGKRVKKIQADNGLKNHEMAAILEAKLDRFQKWLSGSVLLPPEFAEKLSDRFGLSLDYIYRGTHAAKEPSELSKDEINVLRAYREATPEGRNDILRAALGAQLEARLIQK